MGQKGLRNARSENESVCLILDILILKTEFQKQECGVSKIAESP